MPQQPGGVSTTQVTFVCSSVTLAANGQSVVGLPSQYGITCTAPTVASGAATGSSVTITIQTTPRTTAKLMPNPNGRDTTAPRIFLALLLGPLPGIGLLASRRRRSGLRRGWPTLLGCGLLLFCLLSLSSCGGYFPTPAPIATPSGTYYLTITEIALDASGKPMTTLPPGFIQSSLIVPITVH